MKVNTTSIIAAILLTAVFLTVTSCTSTPLEAPADVPAEQLILMAQESYDDGNTDAAIFYYETMLMRYGNTSLVNYITAQYEIAHLLVKQGKKAEAATRLEQLLALYEDDEQSFTLPSDYRKLAENELARIKAAN